MRTTMIALALLLGLAAGGAGTALAQGALSWLQLLDHQPLRHP